MRFECGFRERFGEDVSRLLSARDVGSVNNTALHCISEPEEPQVKVLHPTMVFRVLRHRDG